MKKSLFESRMIRVYLIAMAVLVAVAGVNTILARWLAQQAIDLAREGVAVPPMLETIAEVAVKSVAIGGFVVTITTTLIVRYGAREVTKNLAPGGRGE